MRESLLRRPKVTPFVECPNCKQLLEWGAKVCPRCREEIDSEYGGLSAAVVHYNTQAVSLAKSISTFDAFIPLALIGSVAIYAIDWYTFGSPRISLGILFWPVIPLLAISLWFYRFSGFRIGDDEYMKARRDMKRSFAFWLVLMIVQLLLIAVALRT